MNNKLYYKIDCCRICGRDKLETVLDLGNQALASRFPGPDEGDPPTVPLMLAKCNDCGLVQLLHTVNTEELYTYGYGYRSGTNATMCAHLAGLTKWIGERCELKSGDVVLDIGCNDGTLLKSYQTLGLVRAGIDPIVGKFADSYPEDITTFEGLFSRDSYAEAIPTGKANVITSISMFYDLDKPNDFVATIRDALTDDGIWVLEQSYLVSMLKANSFDTICHEHLEYYALKQIEILADRHGLRVFDVETNDINGGSFRLAVCLKASSQPNNQAALENFRQLEIDSRLDSGTPYEAFAERVVSIRDEIKNLIKTEVQAGKKVYVYGASTKGNTLLQYCGLDHSIIVAAAERIPEKIGRRTPITSIPIISEDMARQAKPDYFLVLPWHFRKEFLSREAEFHKRGGKFIFPLPEVEIV